MSTSRSIDASSSTLSSSRTVSVRSSYFQTEFSGSCEAASSDIETNVPSGIIKEKDENICYGLTKHRSKAVCVSVQAERNIIGMEDTFPNKMKSSIRPPVDGQASSGDSNVLPIYQPSISSDSEEEVRPNISNRVNVNCCTTDHDKSRKKDNSDKTLEGSSDLSLPTGTELGELQRVPTPSSVSSITSKPLEWDSGADVGYYQQFDSQQVVHELSSIERMALDRGRKGILIRSEPEGKSSSKNLRINSSVLNVIGAPASESTPILSSALPIQSRNSNYSRQSKSTKNEKHQHLFPEVIIRNNGNHSDSSLGCDTNPIKPKFVEVHTLPLKKSSSLENLSDYRAPDQCNSTFPRSHSQINLMEETGPSKNPRLDIIRNPPQSLSSSSVATVVTSSPRKNSKCIQTSYNKTNVSTQSSFVNDPKKLMESVAQNQSSTLESAQMTADDRVNSFEYLPGHVYENNHKSDKAAPWCKEGSSLKEDVERGVYLLEEFIQGSNANNTLMKKELIQRVVKRLIHTDYPEDVESQTSVPLRCSTRRSQNRDEAVGESSSENIPASDYKTSGNSSSLSAQSSSVRLSVTESSKSSCPNSHKRANPKSGKQVNSDEEKKIPKSPTDYTSDTKSNWKAPITRAEKLYEDRKNGFKVGSDEVLLEFLNSEREKQLDWIVKEIDHLSNLKCLLQKHEKLRINLQRLKKQKQRNEPKFENNVRATNHQRLYSFRRKPPFGSDLTNKNHRFPLSSSQCSQRKPTEDETWDSHNYDTSDRLKLKKSVSTETRKEDINGMKRSTAYTITFEKPSKEKKKVYIPEEKPLIADRQTLAKESRDYVRGTYHLPTLQDCLLAKRPEIVQRAEMRRKTVAELAAVRQLRQEKRPIVLAAALSSESQLMPPPPPPLAKRVVSQKEMRNQTEKKYRETFEVKKKISERKLKETLKTNRLMADVYNKRLQLLTLKGHTDLSNSIDVIYTV